MQRDDLRPRMTTRGDLNAARPAKKGPTGFDNRIIVVFLLVALGMFVASSFIKDHDSPPRPATNFSGAHPNDTFGFGHATDRSRRSEGDAPRAPGSRRLPPPGWGYEADDDDFGGANGARGMRGDLPGRPTRWKECTGSPKRPHCGPWQPGAAPAPEEE
jgi:hypothetical protein